MILNIGKETEEDKAIENLRKLLVTLEIHHLGGAEDINTVLNLITKLKEELHMYKIDNEGLAASANKMINEQQEELQKKDKIIDEMAEYLSIVRDCPNEDKGVNLECKNRCKNDDNLYAECWKMYFERKVEEN